MHKFDAGKLFTAITGISNMGHSVDRENGLAIPMQNYYDVRAKIEYICTELDRLGLPTSNSSAIAIKGIFDNEVKLNIRLQDNPMAVEFAIFEPFVLGRFLHYSSDLVGRFADEMSSKIVLCVTQSNAEYLDNTRPLFGKNVFDAFPSANEDIAEAGACLALGRGTACVMHLMRSCEVGLRALGKAIGIGKQNDWGSYLREIPKELEKRAKASGTRTADEQFYSEAAASFDHLKRAWRNPTMHVDRAYSPERAEEIFFAVRSIMRLLATRISE
jgi:hypothetical protein